MLKNLAFVLAGIAGATVFIVSCSDDSPHADAAVCDCPVSEPPLAGRITRVEQRLTATNIVFTQTAACPANATLLGGGCYSEGVNALDVRLIMSGDPEVADFLRYGCSWANPPGLEVTVVAWAKCLVPAT